jgi:hypothetical protein
MKIAARILATAALVVLSALPAGGANAGQPDHGRGQRTLERTLTREHHAYPAPDDPQTQVAEAVLQRILAREHHAYPTADTQLSAAPAPPRPPLPTVLAAVGLTIMLVAAGNWGRLRAHLREAA